MYGSEACEHVFGGPSKIMPDFTLLDFFHIMPKIKYMHLTAHQRNIKTPKRSKAGSGYPIEVTKKKDVNLTVLRTWPSDDDLSEALHLAHTEVLAHQMGNCVSHAHDLEAISRSSETLEDEEQISKSTPEEEVPVLVN